MLFNPTFHIICVIVILFFICLSFIRPKKGRCLSFAKSIALIMFRFSCSVCAICSASIWPWLTYWDTDDMEMAFKANYTDYGEGLSQWVGWGDNVNIVNDGRCSYPGIEEGDTLLIMASRQNYVKNVKYLLSIGADRNIRNKQGDTALEVARRNGNKEICLILEGP